MTVVYLNARGVSVAILTTGRWDKVASYVEFMGYTQPWYSVGVRKGSGGCAGHAAGLENERSGPAKTCAAE